MRDGNTGEQEAGSKRDGNVYHGKCHFLVGV